MSRTVAEKGPGHGVAPGQTGFDEIGARLRKNKGEGAMQWHCRLCARAMRVRPAVVLGDAHVRAAVA